MIARLGDFLRLTIDSHAAQAVSLARELEFLRCYLEIEQVRFRDRLRVQIEVEPEALPAQVPNLILQPIIENAIKHGISTGAAAGASRSGRSVATDTC
jgi:two-component system LytT family sensor kinase